MLSCAAESVDGGIVAIGLTVDAETKSPPTVRRRKKTRVLVPAVTVKRTVPRFAERVSAEPRPAETLCRRTFCDLKGKLMSKTASEYLVEALEKTGVKRIYGVVGDSLNGVTDALRRRKSIDWIHMRHEEAAAFAAGAEAHLTGNLAVCAGSCGPGNLHLINGLFDCQRNGVPVLAIAAHIPSSEIGIDYFQATHPEQCSGIAVIMSSWSPIPSSFRRY